MPLHCTTRMAHEISHDLKKCGYSPSEMYLLADSFENMKEILQQIQVDESYLDYCTAVKFAKKLTWSARAVLSDMVLQTTMILVNDPPRMPQLERNAVWTMTHPDPRSFSMEVKSAMKFMDKHADLFTGAVWSWLRDFFNSLDYNFGSSLGAELS